MITDHKLDSAQWVPTKHVRGIIDPELIIVHNPSHWVAPYPNKKSVVHYLQNNDRKVAYHIVIDRNGQAIQMAPFNRRVNHAGRSAWKGKEWCNNFTIAIALASPGPLTGTVEKAKAWFGEVYTEGVVRQKSPYHGSSDLWLAPTQAQMNTLHEVVRDIRETYGDIPATGHYVVSPGRKVDPSPLVDLQSIGAPPIDLDHEVALAEPTRKVLAKTSRKYKTTKWSKNILGGLTVAGVGTEIAKAASIEKITATKAYLDVVGGFISSYGVMMLIGSGVAGWLIFELLQRWQEQDFDEGRYEASGELNEGGGDWA